VGQALKNIRKIFKNKGIVYPEGEAEILLSYFLQMSRSEIYLHSDRILKNIEKAQLEKKIKKRIENVPLQYITKHQEFMGMDFLVEKGVLIPRPETEILVEEVIGKLNNIKYSNSLEIADLGTGTGIIAISIASSIEDIVIYATDISENSLQLAFKNARKHSCEKKIIFLQGDLFKPFIGRIEQNSLDGIISNPPYINTNDYNLLPAKIKDNEPKIALDGGLDGLDYYRKIINRSPQYLKSGGFIALEMGLNQSKTIKDLIIRENIFHQDIQIIKDYSGIERVVIAYRK